MRVKSVPRWVNPNRSGRSYNIKNSEKCLKILNARNESFVDLENPTGLDLSTRKKSSLIEEPNPQLGPKKMEIEESVAPMLPIESNLNNIIYKAYLIRNNSKDVPLKSVQEDKFKDTFLYKIMTDPQFIEKIEKNKKNRKPSCQFCKKDFDTEAHVKDHLNVRYDESKRVTCCACGKTFAQKRYLRYHQRCHSDRSKYVCDICLRKYSRLDNLTRHNIFHTNPDKFPCTMCDRAFARKDLLNKHQKSHENKYKWYCNTCRKYFKGPVTLDNHTRIFHSPETNCNKSEHNVQTYITS